jgi:hypothetical protein
VFTHVNLKPEDIRQRGPAACIKEYTPLFERYLKCRNVGLVYLYLSLGVEQVVQAVAEGEPLVIPPEVLVDEAVCLDVLQLAEEVAREASPGRSLKFIQVTTFQLVSLFRNLNRIDRSLVTFLRGSGGSFTYDSPKFVEAVIRIARGQDPGLTVNPVVRFDEDVQACEKSLDALLTEYERALTWGPVRNPYFFFSGCYGDPSDPGKLDPLNDRAVRAHWFVDQHFQPETDRIKVFWRDLGEIGATQLRTGDPPSNHGQSLVAKRGFPANRDTSQVISGAGLIMSLKAIQDLPPFMNMNRLIVWVDDHLKRQLHERIHHIRTDELESVAEARFKQDRHPNGITARDIARAKRDRGYFDALVAGCMMDSLISQPIKEGGKVIRRSTEFSEAIEEIITIPGTEIDCVKIRPKLQEYIAQRYDDVLSLWQTPEFEGTALYDWACEKKQQGTHRRDQIEEVLEDAFAYLRLVKRWKVSFAAAIERLGPIGNLWLFERVR